MMLKIALNCFKKFCILKGYPKILQSDNGVEFKNHLFEKLCTDHNIKHIFSSPYHPQTNGVVEVAHKEIKKNVILDFSKHPENFNLKTSLLEAVEIQIIIYILLLHIDQLNYLKIQMKKYI